MDPFTFLIYACIVIIVLVLGAMILAFIWFFATGLHMTDGITRPRRPGARASGNSRVE
ncbi:MAG TPA: hypothetical protein VHZ81_04690 [Galbitalea sp.]|jgi:hypothetical protein|nr:hypothetical protein [Galbitalea sp.]